MQIPEFSPINFENGYLSTQPPGCGFCTGGEVQLATAYANGWYNSYQLSQACASGTWYNQDCSGNNLNTNENWVTGTNYFGNSSQSWPQITWANSKFDWCLMNSGQQVRCDTGGGGGGCVAYGTPILTPAGYVPVQDLKAGNAVVEFNFSSGRLVQGTFLSGDVTDVHRLIDINHGWLYLTPTDQPIFVKNETFAGWLHDPQNLTTSDSIFDPVTQSWIHVMSVTLVTHSTKVYDVVTTGANNYVANGALLDIKT